MSNMTHTCAVGLCLCVLCRGCAVSLRLHVHRRLLQALHEEAKSAFQVSRPVAHFAAQCKAVFPRHGLPALNEWLGCVVRVTLCCCYTQLVAGRYSRPLSC